MLLKDFWKFNDENKLKATDDAKVDFENRAKFTETFYKQVNDVIGGDNPNQFLTLLFPGIALSKTDFEYDYEKNAAKGPVVEANESRLANKLYDPFHISGADNGRTLPYQYKSALDALTPIINPNIAVAKNQLRDLILSQYPYKLTKEDDDNEINTFQEVFFSLYDDYVKEMVEWSKEQTEHQNSAYAEAEEEFRKKGLIKDNIYEKDDKGEPLHDDKLIKEFNRTVNDKYLTWYETYGISALNVVNQKMSKLLSVFSVNDMKIIEGILDSGVGAELQEARQTLTNTRKLTPDGGYVYPVKFNPTNWFEYLDTSFPYTDLLDSPSIIADELGALYKRRNLLSQKIKALTDALPKDGELSKAKEKLDEAYNTYQTAFDGLDTAGKDGLKSFTNGILGLVCGLSSTADETEKGKKVAEQLAEAKTTSGKIQEIISGLFTSGAAVTTAVSDLESKITAYNTAVQNATELKNKAALSTSLQMLNNDLANVKEEIQTLEGKLKLSAMAGTDADADPTPNATPPGYSSFFIEYECHSEEQQTEEEISTSTTTKSSGCWIFKTKKTETGIKTDSESFFSSSDTSIKIGMNIAKVGIERAWFNPGVFTISGDMYRLSSAKVSQTYTGEANYDPNNYIFPCFPVAMLIARDITVKLSTSEVATGLSIHDFEKKVGDSKGLLFFNKGNGSATSSKKDESKTTSDSYVVTVRIPTPQVIGFYLENTPADKSTKYENNKNMCYINDFVAEYQKVIKGKVEALKKID